MCRLDLSQGSSIGFNQMDKPSSDETVLTKHIPQWLFLLPAAEARVVGSCPSASGQHLVLPITNVTKRMFISRLPSEWKSKLPLTDCLGCLPPPSVWRRALWLRRLCPQTLPRLSCTAHSLLLLLSHHTAAGQCPKQPGEAPKDGITVTRPDDQMAFSSSNR